MLLKKLNRVTKHRQHKLFFTLTDLSFEEFPNDFIVQGVRRTPSISPEIARKHLFSSLTQPASVYFLAAAFSRKDFLLMWIPEGFDLPRAELALARCFG